MYNIIDKVSLLCVGVFEASKGFYFEFIPLYSTALVYIYLQNKRRNLIENQEIFWQKSLKLIAYSLNGVVLNAFVGIQHLCGGF
ncbi:MAG: hypothetical protein IJF19_02585 [Clostridia bacterium]|nr:hypothetical protein [Clostridia bacterium]